MFTIFADNTMTSGSIFNRQDRTVVTVSTIMRGLERLAARLLRAVVPVVAVYEHVMCSVRASKGCPRYMDTNGWQPGLSGKPMPLGHGQPAGFGNLMLANQIAG